MGFLTPHQKIQAPVPPPPPPNPPTLASASIINEEAAARAAAAGALGAGFEDTVKSGTQGAPKPSTAQKNLFGA